MSEQLQRQVLVLPAYDRRHPVADKDGGIHSADLVFLVKGEHGAVDLVIHTGWFLPHVRAELEKKPGTSFMFDTAPASIGVHSLRPRPDWQSEALDFNPRGICSYLQRPCIAFEQFLASKDYFDVLVGQGSEALWLKLEERYRLYLEVQEAPAT